MSSIVYRKAAKEEAEKVCDIVQGTKAGSIFWSWMA